MEFELKVNNIVTQMRSTLKPFITLVLLLFSVAGFAQFDKVEYAIEDGNFKRALKVTDDYIENATMKKYPETYYYRAQALYELSKDELWYEKNPDAIKMAVKMVKKGMQKDDDDLTAFYDFEDMVDQLASKQNGLAMAQYKINKLSKARVMFEKSYELNSNRDAYYMAAKCAIEFEDTAYGERNYKQLINWYKADTTENAEQEIEPLVYFINKYWMSKKYDSAKALIKEAHAIFGTNAKINYYTKEITLEQIKSMPPSMLMLEYVQYALQYMKSDEKLLHQENSVYIYLLKNKIGSEGNALGDSLLKRFVNEKVAKSKEKQVNKISEIDVFVQDKPENVLWKLAEYFQTYNHTEAGAHILVRYIASTAASEEPADIAKRWGIIADYTYQTKSLPFAVFVLKQAMAKYEDKEDLKALRATIVKEKEFQRLNDVEAGAVYGLMKEIHAIDGNDDNTKRLIDLNDKYLGLLIAANRFSSAKDIMSEQIALEPEKDHSVRKEFIAREDFYQNYFLTKTRGKGKNGEAIETFKWNGSLTGCNAGSIELDIQEKVADRINYFRRNAGVPEVLFDQATNEFCQDAALMMTANRAMEHNPPRTWRCFTDEGAYAAKHSLLIKDANTSLAVTYIMDDKNRTAGNRRWLLYPNGRVYGHGSTDNVAVIWALDDSGSTDTSAYMDNPVCWPPKGHVPQMMLFENWTFSLYRDLKDAKVEVKQDGKNIDVKVEPALRGYGAPTLVFKPTITKTALPPKSKFDVSVTLSNGRKYNYTVNTFYYNPAR